MKIAIISMNDPVLTKNFLKKIIIHFKNDIVAVALTNDNRLNNKSSKILYIISLLFIMGPLNFIYNSFIVIKHKILSFLHRYKICSDPSLLGISSKFNIKSFRLNNLYDDSFLNYLKKQKVDIIINQSQNIIKKELLDIPKIGVINRHNSLLPKNRGRLTPFWVLFKKEKYSGVSIHFVNEKIDSGPVILIL